MNAIRLPAAFAATLALCLSTFAWAGWSEPLHARLAEIDASFAGELGVYVRDIDSGETVSWRADEVWYLASGVKVLVAVAVLRAVEAGELSDDATITLQESDYVDGAGQTNMHPVGTRLTIQYLLEQALVYSDNTATDMLIRQLGLQRVNAVAEELMPGYAQITSLADVRRHAYSGFHDKAFQLTAQNLLELRRVRGEAARIDLLARLLDVPRNDLGGGNLDAVFDAYYATQLNAAPLSAFGNVLGALQSGGALGERGSAILLGLMARIKTGDRRIKAGLPSGTRFAHKTGTQHRRACDFGIATTRELRLVVAACTRGAPTLAQSERVLREVGAAVASSGALSARSVLETDTP
jgi:beta-lactamase class A